MIQAQIITIGDEILIGQIVDTNSAWIAEQLNRIGIKVQKILSISDHAEAISNTLKLALNECELVLFTGGLGPTKDDITKKTLADFFKCDLVLDQEQFKRVEQFFQKLGRPFSEVQQQQALIPSCAEAIPNMIGTAPGIWIPTNGKAIISMPGVPHEMKQMMMTNILHKITDTFHTPEILHRTIQTIGIGESRIAEIIQDWEEALPDFVKLAYLPNLGKVRLRLSGIHPDEHTLENTMNVLSDSLKTLIGQYIFGEGDTSIEQEIGKLLASKKLSISTAESCTGGYLAHRITSIPGSSVYFKGSIVCYSNEIKMANLGVQEQTILTNGAVSEATVIEMAENARKKLGTDIALACSGIAGPGGGSPEKPVGTVWIALADNEGTIAKKHLFPKGRKENIQLTANYALELLFQRIKKSYH